MQITYGREFTPERSEQGFRSQAHLTAFYAHFDHVRDCSACQTPDAPVELDDGLQPTGGSCDDERRLLVASFAEHFTS